MAIQFRAMQAITLGIPGPEGGVEAYPSLVLDFTEGSELVVGVPMDRGLEVRVRPGSLIYVDVTQPTGVVRYRSKVRDRQVSPLSLRVDWPGSGERIQRREHFRVQVQLPVTGEVLGGPRHGTLRGTTLDLSAGGVRIRLPVALPADTRLELRVQLPEDGTVEIPGRVVRSGELTDGNWDQRYWNGVEFTEASESVRKIITRYVFEVQRDQMRKGIR